MLLIKGFRPQRLLTALCLLVLTAGIMQGCAKTDQSAENSYFSEVTQEMNAVEKWLKDKNELEGFKRHAAGFGYKILNEGDYSDTISLNEIPMVTYTRSIWPSETPVESSPLPTSFDNRRLKDHIMGWQLGLPLITKGGRIKLYIPSRLAFGSVGIPGRIPPNAILICDITLIDIRK